MARAVNAAGDRRARSDRRRVVALIALTAWAIAVPWLARALGLGLHVPTRLEIADHVIPGAAVLVCSALLLHPTAVAAPGSVLRLVLIGLACLGGFWITATHAPLVQDALDGVSGWGPALLHLSAGPPITVTALWMLLADAEPARPSL